MYDHSILEELQAAYARTTAVSPYASFKPFSQEEPDEKFAFEWDAKGFEGDFSLEVDPEDLHNTVEGEDNVFEILSGGLEVDQLADLAAARSRRTECDTVLREGPGVLLHLLPLRDLQLSQRLRYQILVS